MELVIQIAITFFLGLYGGMKYIQVKNLRRRVKQLEFPPEWTIQVGTPKQLVEPGQVRYSGAYGDIYTTVNRVDQNQDLIVRVAKGTQIMNMGVVKGNAEDFDEALARVLLLAEERRSTLATLDEYTPLP